MQYLWWLSPLAGSNSATWPLGLFDWTVAMKKVVVDCELLKAKNCLVKTTKSRKKFFDICFHSFIRKPLKVGPGVLSVLHYEKVSF